MNTKTPGQIAKDEYYSENGTWDSAAAAVIAHHEAQQAQTWTLPAPPAGRSWHRNDWTAEMLPDGWRPLSINEIIDASDQFMSFDTGRWTPYGSNNHDAHGSIGRVAMSRQSHVRTRRPLPPLHTIKFTLPPLRLTHGSHSYAHTTS